jgi:hypothetical protein
MNPFAKWRKLNESNARAKEVVIVISAQDRLRHEAGVPLMREYMPGFERAIEKAKTRLGDAEFEKAWAEGRTLDLAQAIEITSRW